MLNNVLREKNFNKDMASLQRMLNFIKIQRKRIKEMSKNKMNRETIIFYEQYKKLIENFQTRFEKYRESILYRYRNLCDYEISSSNGYYNVIQKRLYTQPEPFSPLPDARFDYCPKPQICCVKSNISNLMNNYTLKEKLKQDTKELKEMKNFVNIQKERVKEMKDDLSVETFSFYEHYKEMVENLQRKYEIFKNSVAKRLTDIYNDKQHKNSNNYKKNSNVENTKLSTGEALKNAILNGKIDPKNGVISYNFNGKKGLLKYQCFRNGFPVCEKPNLNLLTSDTEFLEEVNGTYCTLLDERSPDNYQIRWTNNFENNKKIIPNKPKNLIPLKDWTKMVNKNLKKEVFNFK